MGGGSPPPKLGRLEELEKQLQQLQQRVAALEKELRELRKRRVPGGSGVGGRSGGAGGPGLGSQPGGSSPGRPGLGTQAGGSSGGLGSTPGMKSQPARGPEFKAFRLQYAHAADTAMILEKMLGGGQRIRVASDPRTNQVLVQATVEDLLLTAKLLHELDVPGRESSK